MRKRFKVSVLILVLMEYALEGASKKVDGNIAEVLILVLMEYALEDLYEKASSFLEERLNPCSNGICSRRHYDLPLTDLFVLVLILVLMEYALEGY